VNAASARYVRVSLGGCPFRIFGGDGGLRTSPLTVTETLITPGDRVELAIDPFEDEGAKIAIESLPYRRSRMKRARFMRCGTLRIGPRQPSRASLPEVLTTITPLVSTDEFAPTRTIRLGARMTLRGHDWPVNGETHHRDAPMKPASCRSGRSQ
jgi:FtsP/CotA-like multicopper oxidase with cupredoxin domain